MMIGQNHGKRLPFKPALAVLVMLTVTCFASSLEANDFVLEKPGRPDATLWVQATPEALRVTAHPNTPQQRLFIYERFRPGDTDDHHAYYGAQGQTYLRWPMNLRTPVLRLI
ncbi:MAG: hypothetical protein ACR2NZ_05820, partial [Rubripirellula sp.]